MSFGLDPELFLVKKGNTSATSIHLIDFKSAKVKSDSENPVYSMSKTDGFAIEFTNTPTTCRDYLIPSMAAGLKRFLDTHPGYTLSAKASLPLTTASTKGKTPVGVCNYGCIPDRDAYNLIEKTAPGDKYHNNMRYIGGHIHMGLHGFPQFRLGTSASLAAEYKPKVYGNDWSEVAGAAYTLIWDAFVGVPMVAMIGKINDYGEAIRRTYYGQAGSHRIKKYGVEYRVLSGALMMSPFLLSWALGAIRKVTRSESPTIIFTNRQNPTAEAEANTVAKVQDEVGKWFKNEKLRLNDVKTIINNHDVMEARKYCTEHMNILYNQRFVQLMIRADKKELNLPTNITEAWALSKPIQNHLYPGVETLIRYGPGQKVSKKQFSAIDLVTPLGWNDNI